MSGNNGVNDTVKVYMRLFTDKYPGAPKLDNTITENDIRRLLIESKKQGLTLDINKVVNSLLFEIIGSDKSDDAIKLIVQQAKSPKNTRPQRTNNQDGGRRKRTHKRTLRKHKRRTHKRTHRRTHKR